MIQSYIGVDIIEIDRIRQAVQHWGKRFSRRIYTEKELELCHNRPESLAARFSGKEAIIKALNPPEYTVSWQEIEILSTSNGKPIVILHGRLKELANELGLAGVEISLSHSREYAVAMAMGVTMLREAK